MHKKLKITFNLFFARRPNTFSPVTKHQCKFIIIITRRVRPPNGGRNLHRPQQPSGLSHRPLAAGRTLATPGESFRRGEDSSPSYVNALSPPIAGERVGVEEWGGNGHLLEAYSTKPTCKPQSTMCSF